MHIQIVNFGLKGISEEQYREVCDEIAPAFAELPGLLAKFWLADPVTNTYGGVYLWQDREAYEAYTLSSMFNSIGSNPAFGNVTSRDFGILEAPSEVTRAFRQGNAGIVSMQPV